MLEAMNADVLVVGGGTSGTIAAIAAARNGASTILVERYGFLGGTATFGNPMHGFFDGHGEQVVQGIPEELIQFLIAEDGSPGHIKGGKWGRGAPEWYEYATTPYDHELIKLALLKLCADSGVQFLFHALLDEVLVEDGVVKGITAHTKSGRRSIYANVVVDATADGDVANLAGANFFYGDQKGRTQNVTLLFKLGNVDADKAVAALETGTNEDLQGYNEWHCKIVRGKKIGDDKESVISFQARVKSEMGGGEADGQGIILGGVSYRPNEFVVNMTRTTDIDGTNDLDLSRAEVSERTKVFAAVKALKRVPGFEKCFIISTAPQVGVRETRRIVGEYVLNKEDVLAGRRFDDSIGRGAYPIDIHDPDGGAHYFMFNPNGESYGIPYRCLVPEKIDNLIISGRAVSCTHEALGSLRNQATVMAIGQAAGTAAALAALEKCRPRDLNTTHLVQRLVEQKVVV